MQTGVDARARQEFDEVTRLAPGEPSAWANLALLALRRGEEAEARRFIAQALDAGSESGHVQLLAGRVAMYGGRTEEALAAMNLAVALDPGGLRARFAAAALIEREQGDPSQALKVLEEIVVLAPDNLAALVELMRLGSQTGNLSVVATAIDATRPDLEEWPEAAVEQFERLAASVAVGDASASETQVAFLRNVLLRTPAYRLSLHELQPRVEEVEAIMQGFVRLPSPSSVPAAPDLSLTFSRRPGLVEGAGWEYVATTYVAGSPRPLPIAIRGETATLPEGVTLSFPGSTGGSPSLRPVAVADFDYNFTIDLALAGPGGVRLYEQDSTGGFRNWTPDTGLSDRLLRAPYSGVWVADIDLDGDVDIVLGRLAGRPVVLRNNGDRTFLEMGLFGELDGLLDWVWADLDGDGDPDAAALDGSGALRVFENHRSLRFELVDGGDPIIGAGRALAVADIDGDAVVDLLVATPDRIISRGLRRPQATLAAATGIPESVPPGSGRLLARDIDNNGGLDLVVSWPHESRVFLQDTSGGFIGLTSPSGQVLAVDDHNGDGRVDFLSLGADGSVLHFGNEGTMPYHWKEVRPRAVEVLGDQRINSLALGGEIEVRSGLLFQKRVIDGPVVHFGLGDHATAELARLIWPNGDVQVEFDLEAGEVLAVQQRLKGSCPWVFAFDGTRMEFVTDFLWRSPLGMRVNAQETAGIATTEDWVRIRGDQLVPRDGIYDIRITAELWETHFVDFVSLLVVDHPSTTEIFVDERFAIPPPSGEIHVTKKARRVASVRDDAGVDITATVAAVDGTYAGSFELGRYQGVAEPHAIEIDLPDGFGTAESPVLIATGWVRPTDSSINVAISQGSQPGPVGLSLEARGSDGDWTTIETDLGFPAGKSKTILIDLAAVPRGDGTSASIRLSTNLEIYWDAIRWAERVRGDDADVQVIPPGAAALGFRGFSRVTTADRVSPELPDYQDLAGTAQVWRDLTGYYTRFGDVRELLAAVEDRYVIMNAGDELTLHFDAPGPPPEGMIRDFVLVGDGWVKDGDYNTAASNTVLPLPRHALDSYSPRAGFLERDPAYLAVPADWIEYHTRYVAADGFRRALLPD